MLLLFWVLCQALPQITHISAAKIAILKPWSGPFVQIVGPCWVPENLPGHRKLRHSFWFQVCRDQNWWCFDKRVLLILSFRPHSRILRGSNSSGKRYECHCRWPSSIQLAETGQSAKGQLWGPGTPLIRLCLFQMAPLLCRLRQPLGWLKPWLCSSWRNTERGSRGTQSRQVRKRESVSSLTCRSALENECQNALELR